VVVVVVGMVAVVIVVVVVVVVVVIVGVVVVVVVVVVLGGGVDGGGSSSGGNLIQWHLPSYLVGLVGLTKASTPAINSKNATRHRIARSPVVAIVVLGGVVVVK